MLQVQELCINHHLPVRKVHGSCLPLTKRCPTAVQIVKATLLLHFSLHGSARLHFTIKLKGCAIMLQMLLSLNMAAKVCTNTVYAHLLRALADSYEPVALHLHFLSTIHLIHVQIAVQADIARWHQFSDSQIDFLHGVSLYLSSISSFTCHSAQCGLTLLKV